MWRTACSDCAAKAGLPINLSQLGQRMIDLNGG